jgi:hypothetical protein
MFSGMANWRIREAEEEGEPFKLRLRPRTTFSPDEAARVAGVDRATFHSWLARKYIRVESRGQGRARKLTFEQVIQIAVASELNHNLGVSIAAAAEMAAVVKLPIADRGDFLVAGNISHSIVVHQEPGQSLDSVIAAGIGSLKPRILPSRSSCVVIDVSRVAARTRYLLDHPDHKWPLDDPADEWPWDSE